MSDAQKQIRNTGLYLLPVALTNVLPLVSFPIFTRYLTPEDYGVWALAQLYATFATGIANFGLTIGYERNFFEHSEPTKAAGLLNSTVLFVAAALFAFGVPTYLFRDALSVWMGMDDHGAVLFWSYCAVGVVALKQYYLIYHKNTENARAYVWYTVDESLLGLVLSVVLVAWLRLGVLGLIWGQLVASTIVLLVLGWRFARSHPVGLNGRAFADSFRLSLPLTPRIFFGVIGSQFDKYLLGLLGTVGGVGIYNIAQKIAYAVFTVMTAIQNVYAPQVYRRMFSPDPAEGRDIGRYLTPYLYFSSAAGLLAAIFAEEMLVVLTPADYHGAADCVTLLAVLYVTYFFGKQPQLIYAKKTMVTSVMTVVGIVVNVLVNIPFILRWGAIGAAGGTLLAGLITGAVGFYLAQRAYRIHWELRKVVAIFLLLFGSAFTVVILRQATAPYEVRVLCKLAALSAYMVLGCRFGIISRENLWLVRETISAYRRNPAQAVSAATGPQR